MGKVPGTPARLTKFDPRRERRFAKRGIKGALLSLDREAVQRERDGRPMEQTEFLARAREIVQRGTALYEYRVNVGLGRETQPPNEGGQHGQ